MAGAVDSNGSWVETIELVGGALCLDIANTVEGREGPDLRDAIHAPGDLVLWSRRAGVLSEGESETLVRTLEQRQGSLEASLARAMELREVIYRVFTALVREGEPAQVDLAAIQRSFADAMRHARLVPVDPGEQMEHGWRWEPSEALDFDILRWRVSLSAVDLLRHGRLDRLRQCPGGGDGPCNWLFIDTTRAGNRRWCSMTDCGGRAKWRRQNARRRASRP